MLSRRSFIHAVGVVLLIGGLPAAHAQYAQRVTVYKSPSCGCCGEWVKHMRANGFQLDIQNLSDVTPIKRRYGVPDDLASCHTAVIAGYAIEGHVPADDIKRLLRERPKVRGLAVPGMVPGSPGMVQGPPQSYATIAFDDRSNRIYAQH